MKLILKISDVLDGTIVTKPAGDKKYTVLDKLIIRGEVGESQIEVKSQSGTRFLVDCYGNIQAATNDTDVAIQAEPHDLISFLSDITQMRTCHQ